jgi:hypothetical protein
MMRRIFLTLIMGVTLAGAAATSTPFPVLLAMGFLIIFAFFLSRHSEQQG